MYTCKKCGSNSYENFSPTQIRCMQCGNISIPDLAYNVSSDFQLSTDQNILDFEKKKIYTNASLGKRIANYFIDLFSIVVFWMIFFWVIDGISGFTGEDEDTLSGFSLLLSFPFYYIFMEYKFGKTIGKFLTKSTVISKNGNPLTVGQCVGRLCCRFIPFEKFSGLFSDGVFWHDSIPNTLVVNDN